MKVEAGHVACITGAASGIGLGIAQVLHARGVHCVLVDVNAEGLQSAKAKLMTSGGQSGGRVLTVVCDCTDAANVAGLLQTVLDEFGGVQLMFNNAGIGGNPGSATVLGADFGDWERVMQINFNSVLYGSSVFGAHMVQMAKANPGTSPGHVINTSSVAGLVCGMGAYGSSKHGCVQISETLLSEMSSEGVHPEVGCSVLCPGFVKSEIWNTSRYDGTTPSRNMECMRKMLNKGMTAVECGQFVLAGVEAGDFFLLPHPDMAKGVARMKQMAVAGPTADTFLTLGSRAAGKRTPGKAKTAKL